MAEKDKRRGEGGEIMKVHKNYSAEHLVFHGDKGLELWYVKLCAKVKTHWDRNTTTEWEKVTCKKCLRLRRSGL